MEWNLFHLAKKQNPNIVLKKILGKGPKGPFISCSRIPMNQIFKTKTFTNLGLQGYEITVEADANLALPSIEIIGLPDAAVKESKERLRATFRHADIELPRHKIILNLSPSDTKKVGTSLDLAMAIAILVLINEGEVHHRDQLENYIFF